MHSGYCDRSLLSRFIFILSFLFIHCIVFNQLINDFVRVVKRRNEQKKREKNTQTHKIGRFLLLRNGFIVVIGLPEQINTK